MKYYSDITNELYETREQLFKAERDYKMELLEKARADEKARKIADLEAQLAELRGEATKTTETKPSDVYTGEIKESKVAEKLATTSDTPNTDKTAEMPKRTEEEVNALRTKIYNAGREEKIDYSKTVEEIKKMIDGFKFKFPTFEFPDVEDEKDELTADDVKEEITPEEVRRRMKTAPNLRAKTTRLATEKTAPAKTNGSCGKCGKCVKTDTDGDKKRKLADSGYYSSAYVNLNGKEFYSEGADSWNDVKKAVREYFDKMQGLK